MLKPHSQGGQVPLPHQPGAAPKPFSRNPQEKEARRREESRRHHEGESQLPSRKQSTPESGPKHPRAMSERRVQPVDLDQAFEAHDFGEHGLSARADEDGIGEGFDPLEVP